ncbi:MAG: hypothetical protein FD165_1939 [Gammaproteobacteria bacterium]|nr:MAG: hypothetical protein FD165_1939 [Gammaproteobacteria bacterium]TND04511.1 MAG: hypothetical protein FD120_1625 [Gammaproteobacteria bacterium]
MGQAIKEISKRLTPGNITARQPLVVEGHGIAICVINPVASLPINNSSVCLGTFFGADDDWWMPGADAPDGNYALFRSGEYQVELVSDTVASRTIWYAKTDELFIASTSQRAIVYFLQSYEPNTSAYTWMLSSGTLGPGLSWDKRIQSVPPDARLMFDRITWTAKLSAEPVNFFAENLPDRGHERNLRKAISETFDHLDLDLDKWILPLSGGYDSRAILQMLRGRSGLKAITWGLRSALANKKSDACVARDLAQKYGMPHEYLETDLSDEPVNEIFKRFLVAGEGRVDHISGYMDGFSIWKHLFESGNYGVIRGDSVFGWIPVANPIDVRRSVELLLLSDYRNLGKVPLHEQFEQHLPTIFDRRDMESLEAWRDRLYQSYRIPVVMAALNDLKNSYVEIVNPLLSRRIVRAVRKMPDRLRTDRMLFKKIVVAANRDIPFAEYPAIEMSSNILKDTRVIDHIMGTLLSARAEKLFPPDLIQLLKNHIFGDGQLASPYRPANTNLKAILKNILPKKAIDAVRPVVAGFWRPSSSIELDLYKLAFRAYIICEMDRMLCEDAGALVVDKTAKSLKT